MNAWEEERDGCFDSIACINFLLLNSEIDGSQSHLSMGISRNEGPKRSVSQTSTSSISLKSTL
jgi:hypothetical protein